MENVEEIHKTLARSWSTTLANLLPLWLLSFSIMVEGFPRPPISSEVAITSFVVAIVASIVLLWVKWMTIELFLYSLFPLVLIAIFDEISTTYKTPFIILCTLILTAGVIVYQRNCSSRLLRSVILLAFAIATLIAASHATSNFWDMASDLGYEQCFPDAHGCAPLTGQETPWWVLFFSF